MYFLTWHLLPDLLWQLRGLWQHLIVFAPGGGGAKAVVGGGGLLGEKIKGIFNHPLTLSMMVSSLSIGPFQGDQLVWHCCYVSELLLRELAEKN